MTSATRQPEQLRKRKVQPNIDRFVTSTPGREVSTQKERTLSEARAAGGCSDGPRLGEAGVGLGGAGDEADGAAAGVVGVGVFQCPVCGGAFPGGEREADMHVEECLSAGALADIAASGAAGSPWGACTPRKRRCSRVR